MEPVTELLGLQVLLSQVLKITLAISMSARTDNNFATSGITSNSDGLAEVTSLAVDLETGVQEGLESSNVKDGIPDGTAAVNGELGVLVDGSLLLLKDRLVTQLAFRRDGYLSEDGHLKNLAPGIWNFPSNLGASHDFK